MRGPSTLSVAMRLCRAANKAAISGSIGALAPPPLPRSGIVAMLAAGGAFGVATGADSGGAAFSKGEPMPIVPPRPKNPAVDTDDGDGRASTIEVRAHPT